MPSEGPTARDLDLPLDALVKKQTTTDARKRPRESLGSSSAASRDGSQAPASRGRSARGRVARGNAPRVIGKKGRDDDSSTRGTGRGRPTPRPRPLAELTDLETDLARLFTPSARHHTTGRRTTMCWGFLSARGCTKGDQCGYAHASNVDYSQFHELLLMVLTCLGGYPRGSRYLSEGAIRERVHELRQHTEPRMDELLQTAVEEKGITQVPGRVRAQYRQLHGEAEEGDDSEEGETSMQIRIVNDMALSQDDHFGEEEADGMQYHADDQLASQGSGAEDDELGLGSNGHLSEDAYGHSQDSTQQKEDLNGTDCPSWLPASVRARAASRASVTSNSSTTMVQQAVQPGVQSVDMVDRRPRSSPPPRKYGNNRRSPSPRPNNRTRRSRSRSRGRDRGHSRPRQAGTSAEGRRPYHASSERSQRREGSHGRGRSRSPRQQRGGPSRSRSQRRPRRSRSRSRSRGRGQARDEGRAVSGRQAGRANGRGAEKGWGLPEGASSSKESQIPPTASEFGSHDRAGVTLHDGSHDTVGQQSRRMDTGHESSRIQERYQHHEGPHRDSGDHRGRLKEQRDAQAHADVEGLSAALRAKDAIIQRQQEELEQEKASKEAAVNGVHTAVKATMDLLNRALQEKTSEAEGLRLQLSELERQLREERQVAAQWRKTAEGMEQSRKRDRARIRDLEDTVERVERKARSSYQR